MFWNSKVKSQKTGRILSSKGKPKGKNCLNDSKNRGNRAFLTFEIRVFASAHFYFLNFGF
jgi:hypothetical protein